MQLIIKKRNTLEFTVEATPTSEVEKRMPNFFEILASELLLKGYSLSDLKYAGRDDNHYKFEGAITNPKETRNEKQPVNPSQTY